MNDASPPPQASLLEEAERLDLAVYAAIARTPTPRLDRAMTRLSAAADYSRVSIATAAVMSVAGGSKGRRAAALGLAGVAATATVMNLGLKPLGRRRRPDRVAQQVPVARHVEMPASSSFPSGHSAAAFAFAAGAGHASTAAGLALRGLAGLVAYSRVHTGVHYPGDVAAGALIGAALGQGAARMLERRFGGA